ncbi:MAG: guanylate kinase [Candidatus Omnitrophota bacterium]
MRKKGLIFVISGPSGSGKTTLAKRLLKQPQLKDRLFKPASFTTRHKRQGERRGRDYFFVSEKEFRELLKAKKILEHTRYLGYDYGTPRDSIERAIKRGLHVILCLDVRGGQFIKREYPDRAVTIFVRPPSLRIARKRIVTRSKKTVAREIKERIGLAGKELDYAKHYDYCLVNDDLNRAVKQAREIVKKEIVDGVHADRKAFG